MFNRPTVFILGAGASWHYGYPTGEDLVERVVSSANQLEDFFRSGSLGQSGRFPKYCLRNAEPLASRTIAPWQWAENEAALLRAKLNQVNPTLIDYFLADNPELHDIGRLAIAHTLFGCEHDFHLAKANPNHRTLYEREVSKGKAPKGLNVRPEAFKDDWMRFVLYKTMAGCLGWTDLLNNKVSFITFNYDTSLERRLFDGLSSTSKFAPHAAEAFSKDRIFHVYGSLRENIQGANKTFNTNMSGQPDSNEFGHAVEMLDIVFAASKGIRTIDGENKTANNATLDKAKDLISKAEVVYILGFGFDPENVRRLGLDSLRPTALPPRTVFFTNYGGHNRVGAAAGHALMGNGNAFIRGLPYHHADPILGNKTAHFRYEMSVKNVYDAFAEDFESLEIG